MEADLAHRSREMFESAGQGWAVAEFSGRDAVLTGRALDEGEPKAALSALRTVWGVRTIQIRTDLATSVATYTWTAELDEGRVRLSGFVPNEEVRAAVMRTAAETFPSSELDDHMTLARGAPARNLWLARIAFALRHLGRMTRGRVALDETALSISGEASAHASFKSIQSELAQALPAGLAIAKNDVAPPLAVPFEWSAKYRDYQVVLSGNAPAEATREQIFARAKAAFPRAAIIDRTELATGAPQDWAEAAALGLDLVSRLEEGSARLSANELIVSGLAVDDGAVNAVRAALRDGTPKSFVSSSDVHAQVRERASAGAVYTIVEAQETAVLLSGHAPSDGARMALVAGVRTHLPDGTVTDRLRVAAGGEEAWQPCILAGVAGLSRLRSGRVRLSNRHLEVVGEARDDATAAALSREVRSAAGDSCETTVQVRVPPLAPAITGAVAGSATEASRTVASETEIANLGRQTEAPRCQARLAEAISRGVIRFERASAEVDTRSTPTLDELAELAIACPAAHIEVSGHTDAEGEASRNRRLSERRANAVTTYLTRAGVDASRLKAVGYGADRPVAPNDTSEHRALNRRIEFTVLPD